MNRLLYFFVINFSFFTICFSSDISVKQLGVNSEKDSLIELKVSSPSFWKPTHKYPESLIVKEQIEENAPILTITQNTPQSKGTGVGFLHQFQNPFGDGLSFELKGDGSKYYASIFFSYNKDLSIGYEALFPLSSTKWQTITLRWDELIQNHLPFSTKIKDLDIGLAIDPSKITYIGFGTGNTLHNNYPDSYTFSVRNLKITNNIPTVVVQQFNKGLSGTLAKIKQKQPIKVLAIGDSITYLGFTQPHIWYAGQKMKKEYGIDFQVANVGIAGSSVRFGTIQLPRSLRLMPDPDLACIMYGANDCKETELRTDFTPDVFSQQIGNIIDRLRKATNGKTDIILLSGVPRLNTELTDSVGIVEKIAGGVKIAAEKYNVAYVDTLNAYLSLPPEKRKELYKDTIHQNPKGLEYIGNLIFETIKTEVEKK